MAKKRKREVRAQRSEARGRKANHRLLILPGVAAVVGVGLILLLRRPEPTLAVSSEPFPAPKHAVAAPAASFEFVGSERCAECHRAQAEAWRGSTHARAGGAPGRVEVIAPFDGTPIRFADAG
jgi:hypothetical protein